MLDEFLVNYLSGCILRLLSCTYLLILFFRVRFRTGGVFSYRAFELHCKLLLLTLSCSNILCLFKFPLVLNDYAF